MLLLTVAKKNLFLLTKTYSNPLPKINKKTYSNLDNTNRRYKSVCFNKFIIYWCHIYDLCECMARRLALI
jgi:hypothetical protein